MDAHPSEGGDLEDRLGGLIISNRERDATVQSRGGHASFSSLQSPAPALDPDATRLTQENLPDKSKPPRKRLNQAQRRQMSAQLSIPIEPRSQAPQAARPYNSPPGYPHHHQQQQQQHANNGPYRSQRPQSATFRPPSRGNAFSNGPPSGSLFPSHPRHQPSLSYHGPMSTPAEHHDWRQAQLQGGEPRASHIPPTLPFDATSPRPPRPSNALYNPGRQNHVRTEELKAQTDMLEGLCCTIIAGAEIEPADIAEKERFRSVIEEVARAVITHHERVNSGLLDFPPASVQLRCFGSLISGFATKAADMDLGLLSPLSPVQPDAPDSPIPRLVEKAFLDIGLGARLLTRTRVPIIKICEKPPPKLRADLLDERERWERGVQDEADDHDHHDDPDLNPIDDIQPQDYRGPTLGHKPQKSSSDENPTQNNPQQKFRSLRQGEKRSLANYYITARNLFRKLGGIELTNANSLQLKGDDYDFLYEFCLAFVDGLTDRALRERLLSYRSLSRNDPNSPLHYRTLQGVYTQVEGEKMAMVWDSRQIHEKDETQEQQAQTRVTVWKTLQNKPDYGLDPLAYNRELQLASDQLRRIPSIQVYLLSQNRYEPVSTYHSRVIRVLLELGSHDTPSPSNRVLRTVIDQYVRGILIEDVRHRVEEFAKLEDLGLRAVSRRHKSVQLAHEFEKCLEKGLYPEESTASVRAYVELLRGSMVKSPSHGSQSDFFVPVTPESAAVMSEIRRLGDPSKMGPNQPRDPYRDRLEFPKSGVGVQCDVNFSAHLALQNTRLLRCYSLCDPRVRPLVLFVKHWAKVRHINSPYRGTLSSYGYVLMMLHYLVNVAQPFVCPNLQLLARPPPPHLSPAEIEETVTCKGRNVMFWRDEAEIQLLASQNTLTQNKDSTGHLLRGFFEYYAQSNFMTTFPCRGFDWGRDVLSLRTRGGILTKKEKGWTGAKTVIEVKSMPAPPPGQATTAVATVPMGSPGFRQLSPSLQPNSPPGVVGIQPTQQPGSAQFTQEVKEVRHRYLFAIEDPFELDHNVARTVTHHGIVAVRDEFRRAWGIIKSAGKGGHLGDLLQDVSEAEELREMEQFSQLLSELHGPEI
ncbi:hypothetical protein B0T26DRAFT_646393 [Lasiosphaeria miniovina]|uniref:polynucleotide adenylyltransferase n=1 Tax=Lasiosphaeria miniovina TaxID=1954250 RepID=A0AA40ALW4_9PEZI|nr:uncharacterized protein B0T26DRAFT_646393 [Lasiosphaeria miniovina]KAK0718256.1 hypothetical protein B0T26DRAFT_646393 [Lasiosphaeria miniovina]